MHHQHFFQQNIWNNKKCLWYNYSTIIISSILSDIRQCQEWECSFLNFQNFFFSKLRTIILISIFQHHILITYDIQTVKLHVGHFEWTSGLVTWRVLVNELHIQSDQRLRVWCGGHVTASGLWLFPLVHGGVSCSGGPQGVDGGADGLLHRLQVPAVGGRGEGLYWGLGVVGRGGRHGRGGIWPQQTSTLTVQSV